MEGIDKQVTKKDKWKKNDEYLRLSDILDISHSLKMISIFLLYFMK